MFKNFNWFKFLIGSVVLFILLVFVADVLLDKVLHPKEFSWTKIFGFENLFWKISSALVGAYFYASNHSSEKEN